MIQAPQQRFFYHSQCRQGESAVFLQPMEIHGDAEIYLQPMEETHAGAGGSLRGGCEPVEGPWKEKPMLEQPVLKGLHPMEE
ncbi:hypothetical protein DUI87_13026 [Hirundo rustica rustica]|uniref:Uncharacterized protein n=1 Tax=Hirundo rustica rustica TaxID=333673 RepID=A0A3M0KAX1_HIRRU|nr:hypothetical protein DUI87_13026 [Hirundo rustica rustica]